MREKEKQLSRPFQVLSEGAGHSSITALGILKLETNDLGFVWLQIMSLYNSEPHMHIVPLDQTAVVTSATYNTRKWYTLGEKQDVDPTFDSNTVLRSSLSFELASNVPNWDYVQKIAKIDSRTGRLTINITVVAVKKVIITVVTKGAVNELSTTTSFQVACPDGYHFSFGSCVACERGTFNSVSLVKASPDRWDSCASCGENRTTIVRGSIFGDQCLCKKGYHVEQDDMTETCVPCPAGRKY